jgi:hypothetical protein
MEKNVNITHEEPDEIPDIKYAKIVFISKTVVYCTL